MGNPAGHRPGYVFGADRSSYLNAPEQYIQELRDAWRSKPAEASSTDNERSTTRDAGGDAYTELSTASPTRGGPHGEGQLPKVSVCCYPGCYPRPNSSHSKSMYKEKVLEGGNRNEAGASKQIGDARKIAKRNCAHAWCERHDLAPLAQSAAWASAYVCRNPRAGQARSNAWRGQPNCRTPASEFTVAATGDRSTS
jgi:hypothetical protein